MAPISMVHGPVNITAALKTEVLRSIVECQTHAQKSQNQTSLVQSAMVGRETISEPGHAGLQGIPSSPGMLLLGHRLQLSTPYHQT